MTDNKTGPEYFKAINAEINDAFAIDDMLERIAALLSAQVEAQRAHIAALVMLAENHSDYPPYEVEAWREVIPLPPLKECRSKENRRPQCKERHTEDCDYADPPPEPKHKLLPVGTRVLVSDVEWDDDRRKMVYRNPEPGMISGYTAGRSKYMWRREYPHGSYADYDSYAFADNRVEVHPDGPECPPKPIPAGQFAVGSTWRMRKPNTGGAGEFVTVLRRTRGNKDELLIEFDRGEDMPKDYRYETWPAAKFADWFERYERPTAPRVYIQGKGGQQGYVIAVEEKNGRTRLRVHWLRPGGPETWYSMDDAKFIPESQVERCVNGADQENCDEGENQCERCLAAEDAEAEAIEESMR
jgi:hypothetical protein